MSVFLQQASLHGTVIESTASCVTFIEQLMNLVQAKPLSHKLSVMEYMNDKIKDNILHTSHSL